MWKEQLLLLAFFAAIFQPASIQAQSHLECQDINDECYLKTSNVLKMLDTFEREIIKDDSQSTNVLEDAQKRSKEQIEELVNNRTDKIAEQMTQLDQKMGEMQMHVIKVEQTQNNSNGRIEEINTQTKNISEHFQKVEASLQLVKTQVQDNENFIKVNETIDTMMKQQKEESKSQFDQLTSKLDQHITRSGEMMTNLINKLDKLENAQNRRWEQIEKLVNNETDNIREQMTQMDQKLGKLEQNQVSRVAEINSNSYIMIELLGQMNQKLDEVQRQSTKAEQAQHKSDG